MGDAKYINLRKDADLYPLNPGERYRMDVSSEKPISVLVVPDIVVGHYVYGEFQPVPLTTKVTTEFTQRDYMYDRALKIEQSVFEESFNFEIETIGAYTIVLDGYDGPRDLTIKGDGTKVSVTLYRL